MVPLALSIASLRNHSGWNFELNASGSALWGMRLRGLLVLLAALMSGVGGALQAAHYITGRWALLSSRPRAPWCSGSTVRESSSAQAPLAAQ